MFLQTGLGVLVGFSNRFRIFNFWFCKPSLRGLEIGTKLEWNLHKKILFYQKTSRMHQKNLELVKKTSRTHQTNLELVKKRKSNSRKKMELLKKQVEAAKNCLRITKKFESAKTIAGACYKKKQGLQSICHYVLSHAQWCSRSCSHIYIYDRHFHCHHLHYILYCIFIYTVIFVAVFAQAI